MSLCWNGQYVFERGDVVEVNKGNPFEGKRGVVRVAYGKNQFGVVFPEDCNTDVTFWASDLKVIKTDRKQEHAIS